jgi:alkylhydroperoxidase family enzyme
MDINAAGGSDAGIPEEKIAALPDFRTSPLYTEAERAALELADAQTAAPVDVSDELFERLRRHYDEPQLVELAATAALENFRARFNRAFHIEPNSLYCPVQGHAEPKARPAAGSG